MTRTHLLTGVCSAAFLLGLALGFMISSSFAATPPDVSTDTPADAPTQAYYTQHFQASLCSSCGFGNKKDNCVVCGKWCGSTKIPARLCNDCGFGNKKDNCVICGKWCGSVKIPASVCSSCGFGNKKENCAKCGNWAP